MPAKDNPLKAKDLFLLTLKGWVTVQFLDGDTLDGEFLTQDELNVFIQVGDEPIMIPRSQIRCLRGRPGQSVEQDDSRPVLLQTGVGASGLDAKEIDAPPMDIAALEDTDATLELPDEDEAVEGMTMALAEAEAAEGTAMPAAVGELAEPLPEVSLDFDDDEDPTLVFEEEQVGVEDDEATFVLPAEKAGEITAYLDCITGPHAGEVFKLVGGITTIGRAGDNIVSLSNDKEISRKHSRIICESGHFIIEDQNSLNGTFVNDERIEGSRYLEDGDIILVGVSTLVYHEK
ncbi:MAG: FHA domain-containing protein [Anaerolineae bacterium]|nr:FHA domain-containing protein [Anaerolineae bacterium]